MTVIIGCEQREISGEERERDRITNAPSHLEGMVTGRVVKIAGTLPALEQSFIPGRRNTRSETVKVGNPTYILHVQDGKNVYIVQIVGTDGPKNIHTLESVIELGTTIRFPTGAHQKGIYESSTFFSEDKMGQVPARHISIVPPEGPEP